MPGPCICGLAWATLVCSWIGATAQPGGGPRAAAFDEIYAKRKWGGNGATVSLSGGGSSEKATRTLCKLLVSHVVEAANGTAQTVTFLDAPMGDWFWMQRCVVRMAHALPPGATLDYQGVDVSQNAIDKAEEKREDVERRLGSLGVIRPFIQMDLAKPGCFESLPVKKFDVVMCMDALMHNAIADVFSIVHNLDRAGSSNGVFITNMDTRSKSAHFNGEIKTGDFRPLDITKPPFNVAGRKSSVVSSTDFENIDSFEFPIMFQDPTPP
ncbi:hypothetical protein M885DRAFT_506856 [Pelagophyceae sp. CCMP2097]|nr:hypothetical protein M885DRAFT_506856 [Pelagophyceae sp. CCMP2097]